MGKHYPSQNYVHARQLTLHTKWRVHTSSETKIDADVVQHHSSDRI